jgi:sugar diacid utilization regulator
MTVVAFDVRPLRRALERLAALGVVPNAAASLDVSAPRVEEALRKAILDEVSGFTESHNPHVLPELKEHLRSQLLELVRLFEGGAVGDFDFVRAHARRRAEQRFPLEFSLHAYRCGRKILTRWLSEAAEAARPEPMNDAIASIADFVSEYTNVVSAAMTSEYVEQTRVLAAAERDRGAELLSALLSGYDESDGRIARLLKSSGYLEQRQSYCVVAARSANPSEMEQSARAQRIIASLNDLVAAANIKALAGARGAAVIAVVSASRRQSGWTTPQTNLAARLQSLLLQWGPAVLVGVSTDQPSTSAIPKALREATVALEFASVARRVVQFSALPARSLLLHAGGEFLRATQPPWAAGLIAANDRANGALLKTLAALADADLNVQKAARHLGVHANTIYVRLGRIRELTGPDGQRHHQLVELLLVAECARV